MPGCLCLRIGAEHPSQAQALWSALLGCYVQSQLKAVVSSIAIVIIVPVPSISTFCAAVDTDRFVL